MGLSLGDGSGEWHTEGRHRRSTLSLGSAKTTADDGRRGTRGSCPFPDHSNPGRFRGPWQIFGPGPVTRRPKVPRARGCAHFTDGQLRPHVPSPASLEHWEVRVASTPSPLPFRRPDPAASDAVLLVGCPGSPPSSWRARWLWWPPRPKPAPSSPSLQVGGCFIYEVLGGGLLGISVSPAVEFIGLCCLFMKLHLSRASEAS